MSNAAGAVAEMSNGLDAIIPRRLDTMIWPGVTLGGDNQITIQLTPLFLISCLMLCAIAAAMAVGAVIWLKKYKEYKENEIMKKFMEAQGLGGLGYDEENIVGLDDGVVLEDIIHGNSPSMNNMKSMNKNSSKSNASKWSSKWSNISPENK